MDEIIKADGNDDLLGPLRTYTDARIALGRAGNSIPVKAQLAFKMAHAHARDAVYSQLDMHQLLAGMAQFKLPVYHLRSRAVNREQYLKRPDYGRKLSEDSLRQIDSPGIAGTDLAIVITDGLSATAINHYAVTLLNVLIPGLVRAGLKLAPLCITEQGRVAIADEIGFAFKARLSLILIGERPGLSSPDSMGAYLTYGPTPGITDEGRNCISNIRPGGLSLEKAAEKLTYLITEALKRKLTGIDLKDDSILLGHSKPEILES